MDTSSNQYVDEYEGMTLDSGPLTPYLPNSVQVIDSNDKTETTEKPRYTTTKPRLTTTTTTSTLSGKCL